MNGPFKTTDLGEHGIGRYFNVVHHDLTGNGRAQADLAVDGGRAQPLHALFEDEAADLAVIVAAHDLAPHHEDVGDRAVGDPHLVAGQAVAVGGLDGACLHAARV